MYYNEGRDTEIYGSQWGDPENFTQTPNLAMVKHHFIDPYVFDDRTVLEIGCGGGRWTKFFGPAHQVYALDVFDEMLQETKTSYYRANGSDNLILVRGNGTDIPFVPEYSVDYIFTFDVFVHLDIEVIERYLISAKKVLKDTGTMFIHYGDKTKYKAKENVGFSWNSPEIMHKLLKKLGLAIICENTTAFDNSNFVLVKKGAGELYLPTGQTPLLPREEYNIME
jgi:SAM-dependent methyltransferase